MTDGNVMAFPTTTDTIPNTGLTKREYFAAMAMQGLLSSHHNMKPDGKYLGLLSVEYANSLIAALNQSLQKQEP